MRQSKRHVYLLRKKNRLVIQNIKIEGIYQSHRTRIDSLFKESWVYNNQKVCSEFNSIRVYK